MIVQAAESSPAKKKRKTKKKPEIPPQDHRAGLDPSWLKDGSLDGMRVVGIDPGLRDFVTGAVRGDSEENRQTFRL